MSIESDPLEGEAPPSRYDDALLCANWNPVLELLQASGTPGSSRSRSSASDVSEEEANAFLGRVYAFGV